MREHTNPVLFHVTPLHFLPSILRDHALYAKSVLAARGLRPRQTAVRRDRMLGLQDYIHLSLVSKTPLLADKLAKGYPHALIVFDEPGVLALPETALLPYNTKAWRTKSAYRLLTEPAEQARALRRAREGQGFASLEVLVKYGLDLNLAQRIVFLHDAEKYALENLGVALGWGDMPRMVTDPSYFPTVSPMPIETERESFAYYDRCRAAGEVLPPPDLPFD